MKKTIENDRYYVKKRALQASGSKQKNSGESQYLDIRKEVLKNFQNIIPKLNIKPPRVKQGLEVTISEDFSVFTNSAYVLDIIGTITQQGMLKKISNIKIDQSKMPKHDLASEVLIAQAALALKADKISRGANFSVNGVFPDNRDLGKLIKNIGIVNQISSIVTNDIDRTNDLTVFKANGKIDKDASIQSGDQKLSAIDKFINHMNESLSMIGKKLTGSAESQLIEIIGELIGNAEDHSGSDDAHWQFYGYTDKNSKGEIYQQICIFNFGTSIAGSIKSSMDKPVVYERVNSYVKLHQDQVPDDILYTIMALQENISSKLDEQPDRGQGFTDLLLFFEEIVKECTENKNNHIQMSIISGSVSLYFDGKYLPKKDEISNRHLIFFNKDNSFMDVPDSKYVNIMPNVSFPGSIITIKYRLREEDYEQKEC